MSSQARGEAGAPAARGPGPSRRDAAAAPGSWRSSLLAGVLPVDPARVPSDVVAGVTLAALAIPEVMGYTSIAGMPVVTGLYTILLPIAVFALLGSSRHLVVDAVLRRLGAPSLIAHPRRCHPSSQPMPGGRAATRVGPRSG